MEKKPKKITTYVLTLSKNFPSYHPKKGEPTDFRLSLYDNSKIHTIRGNYDLWSKRIDKINRGEAVLSVRQWAGNPYHSKCGVDQEIANFTKLGYQPVFVNSKTKVVLLKEEKPKLLSSVQVAINDGFGTNVGDFYNWFNKDINGIIIHFTDFRY